MKKFITFISLSSIMLSVALSPVSAFAFPKDMDEAKNYPFIDYGKSSENGAQCYDEDCDIVYSDDFTCIMDEQNFKDATCKLPEAHYSDIENIRKGIRATILRILSAK